jgi:hypothetical protein
MSNSTRHADVSLHTLSGFGLDRIGVICKQILNGLAALADRAAERSRFAMLPARYLEDVGMTIAERDALLR